MIFADLNNDGVIDGNDRYRFDATAFPKIQLGLSLGFDYKNFTFNALLQGSAKGQWRLDNGFGSGANGNGLEYVVYNSYTLDNTDAELPRIRPTGTAASDSDFWYHNANFVRLKSFELGYNLPQDILSRVGITGFRLFLAGQNPFIVYNSLEKYGAGDPEFTSGKGASYPNMRTFSLGLNLTF